LLKKVNNFIIKSSVLFSKENLKHILINNFKEVMIIITCFGVLIITFTLLISFCSRKNKEDFIENQVFKDETSIETKEIKEELLLTPSDFIISNSSSFDITNDYIEFMPKKKYELPDKKIVQEEYEKILEDELEESLKFNFEKRKNGE
jgi:hypothetical protein